MENERKSNTTLQKGRRLSELFQTYLKRFVVYPASVSPLPLADIYVVVPVFAEPYLADLMLSLSATTPCKSSVCLVLVVNCPAHASPDEAAQSEANVRYFQSLDKADFWQQLHLIDVRALESKNMGVGLARKIGMDAVVSSHRATDADPSILCLDGDCTVHPNYFQVVDIVFHNSDYQIITLPFRHPHADLSNELRQGILQYELFLEYYRLGLFWAGYPFFGHTVGSSMGVKASAYARHGGMNQRKAGEDFYFLHKLFPHYPICEPDLDLVFPSARVSGRVPFGTGRFQSKWLESGQFGPHLSYHPDCFGRLKLFLSLVNEYMRAARPDEHIWQKFTEEDALQKALALELNLGKEGLRHYQSSPEPRQRLRSFFIWFDGLKALRFIHFFAGHQPSVPVSKGIETLFHNLDWPPVADSEKVQTIRKMIRHSNSTLSA